MSENLVTMKTALRAEAKRARGLLSLSASEQDALCNFFHDNIPLKENAIIGSYWPTGRELDTSVLMHSLIEKGHVVALPVIEKGSRVLKFTEWQDDIDLEVGPYGIHQPKGSENTVWLEPDVFLVPLLAFDRKGYRLGYGGGYYDTTLSALKEKKDILAIGLAYAQQACLFNLPVEDHDVKMDWIVTEQGAQRF